MSGTARISGKVLDQQITCGFGLWKVEVFVGELVHRDLVPAVEAATNTTSSVAGTGGSLNARWGTRLTYGINVPISVIKAALSSKNGSNNSNTTGNPSSTKQKNTGN